VLRPHISKIEIWGTRFRACDTPVVILSEAEDLLRLIGFAQDQGQQQILRVAQDDNPVVSAMTIV
jgi:hypothetical protein